MANERPSVPPGCGPPRRRAARAFGLQAGLQGVQGRLGAADVRAHTGAEGPIAAAAQPPRQQDERLVAGQESRDEEHRTALAGLSDPARGNAGRAAGSRARGPCGPLATGAAGHAGVRRAVSPALTSVSLLGQSLTIGTHSCPVHLLHATRDESPSPRNAPCTGCLLHRIAGRVGLCAAPDYCSSSLCWRSCDRPRGRPGRQRTGGRTPGRAARPRPRAGRGRRDHRAADPRGHTAIPASRAARGGRGRRPADPSCPGPPWPPRAGGPCHARGPARLGRCRAPVPAQQPRLRARWLRRRVRSEHLTGRAAIPERCGTVGGRSRGVGDAGRAARPAPLGGNAQRAVRLLRPIGGRITDGFGWVGGRRHTGLDIPASSGRPVGAAGRGIVAFGGWNTGGYGIPGRHPASPRLRELVRPPVQRDRVGRPGGGGRQRDRPRRLDGALHGSPSALRGPPVRHPDRSRPAAAVPPSRLRSGAPAAV